MLDSMPDLSTDEKFLLRALDLARQGIGLASPNPYVGAVIVDPRGGIAGTGVYTYEGVKHAEIRALEHTGDKARGGTLYINLEPHSHQGRTPPCTEALIAAGIRRVVACMPDPNPKVSGSGFEKLRAAGIVVEVGALEAEARRLNEAFARYVRHGVPLVTLKSAMTLDEQQPARVWRRSVLARRRNLDVLSRNVTPTHPYQRTADRSQRSEDTLPGHAVAVRHIEQHEQPDFVSESLQ